MSSAFSFTAADMEPLAQSRPHTPPYTPSRTKIGFQRTESPAPSIHPTETVSPSKPVGVPSEVPSTVIVQELVEGHPDYLADIELVYPDELEEYDNASGLMSDISDSEEDSDYVMSNRMSQLQCEDKAGEAKMQRIRKERRLSKRLARRPFKRRHSQSGKSESEATDVDAMDDQDLASSARRLRRRTKGPDVAACHPDLSLSLSPDSSQPPSPSIPRFGGRRQTVVQRERRGGDVSVEALSSDDAMDTSD